MAYTYPWTGTGICWVCEDGRKGEDKDNHPFTTPLFRGQWLTSCLGSWASSSPPGGGEQGGDTPEGASRTDLVLPTNHLTQLLRTWPGALALVLALVLVLVLALAPETKSRIRGSGSQWGAERSRHLPG